MTSERLTLARFSQEWLENVEQSVEPKTFESYESNMRVHVVPKLGNIRLSKLSARDISTVFNGMVSGEPAGDPTMQFECSRFSTSPCVHTTLAGTIELDQTEAHVFDAPFLVVFGVWYVPITDRGDQPNDPAQVTASWLFRFSVRNGDGTS